MAAWWTPARSGGSKYWELLSSSGERSLEFAGELVGPGEQEALALLAAKQPQSVALRLGLDPLSGYAQSQRFGARPDSGALRYAAAPPPVHR